jgi:hypothetical protein
VPALAPLTDSLNHNHHPDMTTPQSIVIPPNSIVVPID